MYNEFLKSIQKRRSYYDISKKSPIKDDELQNIIQNAVKHTPSAFNSQTSRVILLLGNEHDALWDITKNELKKIVPADSFSSTEQRINSFKNGYGSVLFFEEQDTIKSLQEQFAIYKDNFPVWSLQSSGMLQLVVWTALEEAGFGASIQHYNPLIDEKIKEKWKIPDSWKLWAQMPFGLPVSQPPEKEFNPIDERIKVFK